MNKKIKYGVVGVGHLGNFHAQQIKTINDVCFCGVYDVDSSVASQSAARHKVCLYQNINELLVDCDAVSVVVPTPFHFEIAFAALQNNCHVFIEKPITSNPRHAKKLIALAKKNKLKLQVGHIERFNPTYKKFCLKKHSPLFIESHRLAPFNVRGSDVAVVLDLMIHDIDLVLQLVSSKVVGIQASGASVVSEQTDLANARLAFDNGTVANLTASRVSTKQMRQMRVFEKKSYTTLDLHNNKLTQLTVDANKNITSKNIAVEPGNALFGELESFVKSITTNSPVLVSGEDGLNALIIATKIQKNIEKK